MLLLLILIIQLSLISKFDKKIIYKILFENDILRKKLRYSMITFTLNVFPNGKPFKKHILDIEYYDFPVRIIIFLTILLKILLSPYIAFYHSFMISNNIFLNEYKKGGYGLDKLNLRKLKMLYFYLKHPLALDGEGFNNGSGLAVYSAIESLNYPVNKIDFFYKIFHDKLWQNDFFIKNGVMVAKIYRIFTNNICIEDKLDDINKELIWKPVYGTMGLGIKSCYDVNNPPSDAYYMLVEKIQAKYYKKAEWFRICTIWRYENDEPELGYCWRTYNDLNDNRVNTDIIGGDIILLDNYKSFINKSDYNINCNGFYDKKNNIILDSNNYNVYLISAFNKCCNMHKQLGKELSNIGWDIMINEKGVIFLELNINNGFLVSDHGIDQCNKMIKFYKEEYNKRVNLE